MFQKEFCNLCFGAFSVDAFDTRRTPDHRHCYIIILNIKKAFCNLCLGLLWVDEFDTLRRLRSSSSSSLLLSTLSTLRLFVFGSFVGWCIWYSGEAWEFGCWTFLGQTPAIPYISTKYPDLAFREGNDFKKNINHEICTLIEKKHSWKSLLFMSMKTSWNTFVRPQEKYHAPVQPYRSSQIKNTK